ncbi:MAG: membrane protein insertion efficiency factor YidD [Burkholderiales bacterium]|nr:membrane protein insertion efficiency factor YidD [Burkholderiales bacterium]
MKQALVWAIRGYQFMLSPWIGNQCRFYPTCSEYACLAIIEHGSFKGVHLALRRTLKCHPWHRGGIDLVPAADNQAFGTRNNNQEKL